MSRGILFEQQCGPANGFVTKYASKTASSHRSTSTERQDIAWWLASLYTITKGMDHRTRNYTVYKLILISIQRTIAVKDAFLTILKIRATERCCFRKKCVSSVVGARLKRFLSSHRLKFRLMGSVEGFLRLYHLNIIVGCLIMHYSLKIYVQEVGELRFGSHIVSMSRLNLIYAHQSKNCVHCFENRWQMKWTLLLFC